MTYRNRGTPRILHEQCVCSPTIKQWYYALAVLDAYDVQSNDYMREKQKCLCCFCLCPCMMLVLVPMHDACVCAHADDFAE
jgi:hypothetical protein